MKPFYYCHAIAEPLREASDMKPLLFRMVTRMRVYKDTAVARVKYKFFQMTTKKTLETVPAD
jgi:hypothetical protein